MAEKYPENSVVLRMEPLSWSEEEYFESISQYESLAEARHTALHFSCMSGTRTVHVYGKGGELAFFYERETNRFSPVSDEAKEWAEAERQAIWKDVMSKNFKAAEQKENPKASGN